MPLEEPQAPNAGRGEGPCGVADYLTTYLSEYCSLLAVSRRQVVGSQVFWRGWLLGRACQIVFRWEGTLHLRPNFTRRCPTSCMGRYFPLGAPVRSAERANGGHNWEMGRVLTTTLPATLPTLSSPPPTATRNQLSQRSSGCDINLVTTSPGSINATAPCCSDQPEAHPTHLGCRVRPAGQPCSPCQRALTPSQTPVQ